MEIIQLNEEMKIVVSGMLKRIKWTKKAGINEVEKTESENSVLLLNEKDKLSFCLVIPEEKQYNGIFSVDFTEMANEEGGKKINCSIMFFSAEEGEEGQDILKAYREQRKQEGVLTVLSEIEFQDGAWVYDGDSEKVAREIVEELESDLQNGFASMRLQYFLQAENKITLLYEYYNDGTLLEHAKSRAEEAKAFIEREQPRMMEVWAKEEGQTVEEFQKNPGLMNNLNMTLQRQALEYYIYS